MGLNHRDESVEDYLETILILTRRIGSVRSIDIVQEMNYSKPSVSIAMKKLKEKELITIDDLGHIHLTEQGFNIAQNVLERHDIISSLLIHLGVNKDIAFKDACRIEHDLSEETFNAIKNYYNKMKK